MKKRDSMKRVVQLEEEEKANIQRDLTALTKRLTEIDESLSRKYACVEDYENTIHNVESAYSKVSHLTFKLMFLQKKTFLVPGINIDTDSAHIFSISLSFWHLRGRFFLNDKARWLSSNEKTE